VSVTTAPETYTGPIDPPKMVRHRRVRRGWVGVGVLLIVLSALGAATLFRAIGPSQEYLGVARDVAVGAQITSADLRIVRLNASPGLNPVPVHQVDQVIGRYAAVPLVAGTLLSLDQLTDEPVPGPGEQLLAIAIPEDQLPESLGAGDEVMLVGTGNPDPDAPPVTFPATVHDVRDGAGRGDDMVVSLLTSDRDGAEIAALAASGDITIVLSGGGG
jgi:hypothetical protein